MTSTPFNVGLGDGSRLSSRVLRPPGGGHTDIFGGEAEPVRGRRPAPNAAVLGKSEEPLNPTNGTNTMAEQNGQSKQEETSQEQQPMTEAEEPKAEVVDTKAEAPAPEPPKNEPPKRVRVPPGGFSSQLCLSESTGCGSTIDDYDIETKPEMSTSSHVPLDDDQFANIDLRYGGQYLTPEQLPEFCNQLHNLVEVIRNIQSYAKVTGEYPSELEHRLEMEAREVASLAAEARNAHDVVVRTRAQRRAVRAQKKNLVSHLSSLRETEVRELESTVRLSDRKLFKSWESLKDTSDPSGFEPLLDEIKNKQTALECLVRLIDGRRSTLARSQPPPQPLPPPAFQENIEELPSGASNGRRRQDGGRRVNKRWRKEAAREPRSVPLSGEPSRHEPQPQGPSYTDFYTEASGSCSGHLRAPGPLCFGTRGGVYQYRMWLYGADYTIRALPDESCATATTDSDRTGYSVYSGGGVHIKIPRRQRGRSGSHSSGATVTS